MTPAELNIIINVRAKAARDAVNKMMGAVKALDIALDQASASTARFVGTVSGSTMGLKMASAALSDLAKSLALIGKSGASRSISSVGGSAGLAATALMDAAAGAELLNGALSKTVVVGNSSAAALERLALAGKAAATNAAAAAGAGAAKSAAGVTAASAASAGAAKKTALAGKEIQRFTGNWEHFSDTVKRTGKELDLYDSAASRAARGTDTLGDSTNRLSNNALSPAAVRAGQFQNRMTSLGNELTKVGSRMQWAGRQMSLYFTAPTALAIGMGTKWILELQKEQTNLKKVYDAGLGDDINDANSKTAKQFEILTGKIKELSNQTGTSQKDITEMAAAWAQAGKSGQELYNATELTNKAMIVGDINAQQAAEGMQAIGLQWQLSSTRMKDGVSEMQGALQTLNLASNITQVSMQDLFIGMEKVGGNAKVLGFTFSETTALLTALTRVTGSASTAGNGLKSIMTRLLAPTTAAEDELAKLGITVNSLEWQSKAPIDRLKEIGYQVKDMDVDSLARFNKEFAGLYQITRGAQIFKDIVDENGNIKKVLDATADGVNKNSQSFKQWQQELQTFFESNPQKFKIAGEMIRNSLMDVVIVLLPYLLAAAKAVAKMAQAFADADPMIQKLVIGFLLFLALIGPLAAFFGAFQILFGTSAKMIAFFSRNFTKAGREAKNASKDIAGGASTVGKSSGGISAAAKKIRSAVIGGITAPFKSAATTVAGSSASMAASANTAANATAAGAARAAAGSNAAGAAAAAGAAKTAAAHKAATKGMLISTAGMTEAEIALARAKGRLLVGEEVKTGAAQTAAKKAAGAQQLAATATNQQAEIFAQQRAFAVKMAQFKQQQIQELAAKQAMYRKIAANAQIEANRESAQRKLAANQQAIARVTSERVMYTQMAAVAQAGQAKILATERAAGTARIAQARATSVGMTGAMAAGSAGTIGAATVAGKKAGTTAANETKKSAQRGIRGGGGIFGTALTAAMFIPPEVFGKIGSVIKSGFTKVIGSTKGLFAKAGADGAKGFGRFFVKGLGGKGGLIGAAIAAVVGMLVYAFGDIKKIISDTMNDDGVPILAKPFIIGAKAIIAMISKLPEIIKDVFMGIVNMITSAAKAVYNAFSYINPFARHSPSLVENVQNGMAVVTSTFADSSRKIQGQIHGAYSAISQFGRATAGLKGKAKGIEIENTTKDLNRADPTGGAARAYMALNAQAERLQRTLVRLNAAMIAQQRVVDGLEAKLKQADAAIAAMQKTMDMLQKIADATGEALSQAQEKLDYYANAPLKGMKAMNDAIFENEMAQKRLQLQIMKLEEAGQTVDDVKDKYAKLQGEIENLSGERADLQAKGAGSDILATYDKMIADLKAQQNKSLEGPSSEIEKLNKQLDDLSKKGQMLDLENSLKFDPLKKQIDDVVNAEQELDFGTAINGARAYKAQVQGLTIANNLANAAVKAQQAAIDGATAARDQLQEKIDGEKDKLDQLKTTYDQTSTAIDDTKSAMDEITNAAGTVNQRLDEIEQKQKEAEDAAKKHKEGLDDLKDSIEGLPEIDPDGFKVPPLDTTEMDNKLNNLFPDVGEKVKGFFSGLGGKLAEGIKWIGSRLVTLIKSLPSMVAEAWSYVIGWLIGNFIKMNALGLKILFVEIPKWIGKTSVAIFNAIKNIDWGSAGSAIAGGFIGLFTGETWVKIWNAIKTAFGSLGTNIYNWLKEHVGAKFADGFRDGIGQAGPALVEIGKKIPGYIMSGINAVGSFLGDLPGKIWTALQELPGKVFSGSFSFGTTIGEWIGKAISGGLNLLGELGKKVGEAIAGLPELALRSAVKLGEVGQAIGRAIADAFKPDGIVNKLVTLPSKIGEWIVKNKDKIFEAFKKIWDWVTDPRNIAKMNEIAAKIVGFLLLAIVAAIIAVPALMLAIGFTILAGILRGIWGATEGVREQLGSWAMSFLNGIATALNPANWPAFAQIGMDIIGGVLSGMWEKMREIGTWINVNVITPLLEKVRELLGIHSPSTVFAEIGGFIIEGLKNGVVEKFDGLLESFGRLPGLIGDKLSELGGTLGRVFSEAWNYLSTNMGKWADPIISWFRNLPELIREALSGIGEKVKIPINWVIRNVYTGGIKRVWDGIADKIGLGKLPDVQELAKGGTVGNRVVGPGTGTSDSILTAAKPGSEIFTAAEVRNAGGFRGLEAILWSLGVRNGGSAGGGLVPVALSNGEYKLDPRQVAQAGGADQVKKIRSALAAGQIPGHFPGGSIIDKGKDIVGGVVDKGKDLTRGAAADLVKKALEQLDGFIPDEINPPGGEAGQIPQKAFDSLADKIVAWIRGDGGNVTGGLRAADVARKRYGGTIPHMATGGTVPSGGASTASVATGAAPAGAVAGGGDTSGAGLAESVTAATTAASTVWQTYITKTQTDMATMQATLITQAATWQATDLAQFTAYTTQKSALQLAANATFIANETLLTTQLTTLWTTWRTTELSAQSAWYATVLTNFNGFATSYQTAVQTMLDNSLQKFADYRVKVNTEFDELVMNMKDTVDGPLTEVFTTIETLLNTMIENFDKTVLAISESWNGVKKATADPVNFTITDVYGKGLMPVWNGVAELIGGSQMKPGPAPIAYATGGPVRGPGTETSDSIPAMLSRGEYVLSANAVKRAGGVQNLNTFNFGSSTPQGMFNIGGDYRVHLATGGPTDIGSPTWKAFQRGHMYAKKISPGPYYLGGSSGGSRSGFTDCSGFQSEVADVIMGGPGGQRKWATGSFPGGGGAQGSLVRIGNQIWKAGLGAGHSIGISVPHAAGTLSGIPGLPNVNIESGGGTGGGATYGGPAVGADSAQFPTRYHLAITDGMFVSGGGAGGASMQEILMGMAEPGLKKMVEDAKKYPVTGIASKIPLGAAETWSKLATKKIEEEAKKLDAMGPPVGGGSGDVNRWRGMVIAALKRQGFAATPAEVKAMLEQIWDESKGDPDAVNNWDINAQNGIPSRGLLQTVPGTFETFRDPSIPGGITDPWANMNAALRYYRATYGNDLTTHWGAGKGGYDSGGWLPDTGNGYGTYFNHTGVPEAVLTDTQWRGIYAAASRPIVTVNNIADGFVQGMEEIYGLNTDGRIQDIQATATEVALQGANAEWNPLIIGAAEDTANAVNSTTAAVDTNTAATYKTTDTVGNVLAVNKDMSASLEKMTALLTAISSSSASGITVDKDGKISAKFSAFAPAITALGEFIGNLPDLEPSYVSWAGTGATVTEEMKREKQQNDISNAAKGLYYGFKTVAPTLLKHTAIIGSAIEQLIEQDAAGWAAAATQMAAGNPVGFLAAGILILKEIMVLLPLILNAIMEIGPAIIQSIIAWFTKFEPDAVYAYGSYEDANKAVNDNQTAIRNGATAPSFETVQQGNSEVTFNIANLTVQADNQTTADSLIDNLLGLAGI